MRSPIEKDLNIAYENVSDAQFIMLALCALAHKNTEELSHMQMSCGFESIRLQFITTLREEALRELSLRSPYMG
jgi:hypothetical protein